MRKTAAPTTTPMRKPAVAPSHQSDTSSGTPSSVFIAMALDMSWRLALVVLVPIIGGYELDQKLNLYPLLTVAGFVIAIVGMALVLWRTVQVANRQPIPKYQHPSLSEDDDD